MRKLKIAQIAPMWFAVPPKKYGGTERIISFLSERLTEKGHKVTLFASGDSKTKAKLLSLTKEGIIPAGGRWTQYFWNVLNHSYAFEQAKDFDVIHCHWELMGTYWQRFVKTPVVHTLHNIPGEKNRMWEVYKYFQKDTNLVFISKSEKKNAVVKPKNSWIIYNGIDLSPFKFNNKPKDHYIWVARVVKEKGIENVIKIAQKTGIKLLMAGQVQHQHQQYFNEKVKPHLNKKIKFVGELSQKELGKFYAEAKALLYPIEWEEPFGLVMVEAMATGTPVIAFKRGSVPEVIVDKKTGFIVKTNTEVIKALSKIEDIDRMACRKHVEDNFTLDTMVDEYEKMYYELIKLKK